MSTSRTQRSVFDGDMSHDTEWCLVTSRFIKRVEGAVLAGPQNHIWDTIFSKHAPAIEVYLRSKSKNDLSSPTSSVELCVDEKGPIVAAVAKLRRGERLAETTVSDCDDSTVLIQEMYTAVNAIDPVPDSPVMAPLGGVVSTSTSISIVVPSPDRGVSIRYTLDGTNPGPHSSRYLEPFLLFGALTTVRACAVNDATQTCSPVISACFVRDLNPEATILQCMARCCTAKAIVAKLARKRPHVPVMKPSGGIFFDGVHLNLQQAKGSNSRIKYGIKRPGKETEFFTYFRPVAVTTVGTFDVIAIAVRSNGVESLPVSATFTIHNQVLPPRISPENSEHIFKDKAEVNVVPGNGMSDDIILEFAVGKVDSNKKSANNIADSLAFTRFEETFFIREQGDHQVTAVALQRGPFTGRWHTSAQKLSIVKVRRSIYRIPKEIVNGIITVAGSSMEFLKRKEDCLIAAISQTLKFDSSSGSRCRVTAMKENGSAGDVDVHFAVELDGDDTVNLSGKEMVRALNDRRWNERLSTELREVGLTTRANRAKGLGVKIDKVEVEYLRKVTLDLSWSYGDMGEDGSSKADYLDGSCLIFESENVKNIIDFRNKSVDSSVGGGGVTHSGDVMDHVNKRGRHIINLDLDLLPSGTTDLALCLSAFVCKDLSKFKNPSIELFSASTQHSLTTFVLNSDDFHLSAAVMSMISKCGGGWRMTSCGFPCGGTAHNRETYQPMIEAVAPLQERHPKWMRRGPSLMALQLLQKHRSFPVAGQEKKAQVFMLIDDRLPIEILHEV
eukprot:CAMPEP_0171909598 /NCGR_PEP_ID=MMETSP0993-20121228/8860_1 /TAXON_ID=483369 /ORGANISM="non described non described, Strain CCMP2098" /LENGTH=783 /DNA_ID=CAMNT_0012542615 /DNA_START=61 /DNA_END=2408 /DNA_ORIENTATION=+